MMFKHIDEKLGVLTIKTKKEKSIAKNGNRKNIVAVYPGRPKGCNKMPGEYACKRAQRNKSCRLCIHCRSLEK